MRLGRRSGILLHPTSLPSPLGIGDLGTEAERFVEFLAAAGQSLWQVLPLGPAGYGASPYQSPSAFAGNPLLISPQRLVECGHLSPRVLAEAPSFPQEWVDYPAVEAHRRRLLEEAALTFRANSSAGDREGFERFCAEQAHWLDDYALYTALKEAHAGLPWYEWDAPLATRAPQALAQARTTLAAAIECLRYQQWQFFEQWHALKRLANLRGVSIIGDLPIFVALDSADVWANPRLFHLDAQLRPTVVSGVPPDYFSPSGQLWGHPLYRWEVLAQEGYAWWIARFRHAFTQADVVRVDHFRAFHNYWEVPAGAPTAMEGRWQEGPGAPFFRAVIGALGPLALIAEDLGEFDAPSRAGVDALQAEFGFPGMRVLQFAFGGGADNLFLPHHYPRTSVVYTGTHDNDTLLGWYQVSASAHEREHVRRYLGRPEPDIPWDLIRLAWASVADTAITTAQDLLGLGHAARMNTPGTAGPPNWCWRMRPAAPTEEITARLHDMTEVYGRLART